MKNKRNYVIAVIAALLVVISAISPAAAVVTKKNSSTQQNLSRHDVERLQRDLSFIQTYSDTAQKRLVKILEDPGKNRIAAAPATRLMLLRLMVLSLDLAPAEMQTGRLNQILERAKVSNEAGASDALENLEIALNIIEPIQRDIDYQLTEVLPEIAKLELLVEQNSGAGGAITADQAFAAFAKQWTEQRMKSNLLASELDRYRATFQRTDKTLAIRAIGRASADIET